MSLVHHQNGLKLFTFLNCYIFPKFGHNTVLYLTTCHLLKRERELCSLQDVQSDIDGAQAIGIKGILVQTGLWSLSYY